MKYSFHPEAKDEFELTIEYYEECDRNLGYDFAVEIYAAIERASSYPKAWPAIEDEIRRTLVKRFPYGLPCI